MSKKKQTEKQAKTKRPAWGLVNFEVIAYLGARGDYQQPEHEELYALIRGVGRALGGASA